MSDNDGTVFEVAPLLDDYTVAAEDIHRMLAGDARVLAQRAPTVSGWSAVEHASHATLANELVLRNLVNLARGAGMLVIADATQDPRALAVLAAGQLPRGQARSPRMVVPPSDIDVATAREWAARFVEELTGFRRGFDPRLERARLFVPHQLLGPLDLGQWARFGVVHSRHHLAIARETLAALG
jgi:hypothetical protein